jgi:DNA-binding MarR family transcriptional regulator
MSSDYTFAQRARRMHVTPNECAAMRLLYADDRYTQSDLAFMFEYQASTISRHVNKECSHDR